MALVFSLTLCPSSNTNDRKKALFHSYCAGGRNKMHFSIISNRQMKLFIMKGDPQLLIDFPSSPLSLYTRYGKQAKPLLKPDNRS